MFNFSKPTNSRSHLSKRLFFLKFAFFLLCLLPLELFAHPSPNTLVFLDISPDRVAMEVQMPVPELELVFGHEISKDPQTIVERFGPQLTDYLLAHIQAYVSKSHPWTVVIKSLKMDKGKYVDSNIPYWEVNAEIFLLPQPGEGTRTFSLAYDAIMHQVVNHAALVSIRNDWETGTIHQDSTEAAVIGWNLKDNRIPALEINLDKGSRWRGFASMVGLGMQHIKEGTDHLLFLLVLLLPAMLLVKEKAWQGYGGTGYSTRNILKIVTAFTLGHSITLLLAALGWVRLPQQPVEILIALSILVSAIHAIRPIFPGKEMYVAVGFGLIHGLAFATVLSELNLGTGTLALSILGFNLGIETMQLLIVVATVPWLIILSRRDFYKYLRVVGAIGAAMAAIIWIVQRSFGVANSFAGAVEGIANHARWFVFFLALLAIASFFWSRAKRQLLKTVHVATAKE